MKNIHSPHPPYSPDIPPPDYHLFQSLQNHFDGKTFDSLEGVENDLFQFFDLKPQDLLEEGNYEFAHEVGESC